MLIKFQISYYIWYHPFCEDQLEIFNPKLEEKINYLYKMMREKFPSMKMSPEIPFDFNFNDKSDEAAFLLWSSDGIEL